MTDTRQGKCMCGAVQFTLSDPEAEIGACHCEMCRRWTGTALMALSVPEDKIAFQGNENVRRIQSSAWAERAWCDKCGSGLWYRVTAESPLSGVYQIPVGLLDDTQGITLSSEIFFDCKPGTYSYAGDTEKMTRAEIFELYGVGQNDANDEGPRS